MKSIDKLFFFIVLACFVAVCMLLFYMMSEGGQCIKNPFIYGAVKMKNVECSCLQYNDSPCPATFFFNSTIFNASGNSCKGFYKAMNYSY